MIAVDTSAIMAILLDEPEADRCAAALETEDQLVISAGTLAEVLIVASRRNRTAQLSILLDGLSLDVVNVTPKTAKDIGAAYEMWGKGVHPAGLNFGDCFAYELAKSSDCPLLYIGNDFAQTDVKSAL